MSVLSSRPLNDVEPLKFSTAEEAWFWFMRCEAARAEGARPGDGPRHAERPCSPDDIMRWLNEMYADGTFLAGHVWVLGYYGALECQPDAAADDEIVHWWIWVDAFDFLEALLREMGIIEWRLE